MIIGFNLHNHITLFNLIHELNKKNVKLVLSNADVKLLEIISKIMIIIQKQYLVKEQSILKIQILKPMN